MTAAILKPAYPTSDKNIVAVVGHYSSEITREHRKFEGATATIRYFGTADFNQLTARPEPGNGLP